MTITITVHHNIATDPQGRHLGWVDGYRPEHKVAPVYQYEHKATVALPALLRSAFDTFNGYPATRVGEWHSKEYYAWGNRSLSVGDVVLVEAAGLIAWFAVARSGWEMIAEPVVVRSSDLTGTVAIGVSA